MRKALPRFKLILFENAFRVEQNGAEIKAIANNIIAQSIKEFLNKLLTSSAMMLS